MSAGKIEFPLGPRCARSSCSGLRPGLFRVVKNSCRPAPRWAQLAAEVIYTRASKSGSDRPRNSHRCSSPAQRVNLIWQAIEGSKASVSRSQTDTAAPRLPEDHRGAPRLLGPVGSQPRSKRPMVECCRRSQALTVWLRNYLVPGKMLRALNARTDAAALAKLAACLNRLLARRCRDSAARYCLICNARRSSSGSSLR